MYSKVQVATEFIVALNFPFDILNWKFFYVESKVVLRNFSYVFVFLGTELNVSQRAKKLTQKRATERASSNEYKNKTFFFEQHNMEMVPFPFDLILCIFHNPFHRNIHSRSLLIHSYTKKTSPPPRNPNTHKIERKYSQMPPNKYKMNLPPTLDPTKQEHSDTHLQFISRHTNTLSWWDKERDFFVGEGKREKGK